MSTKIIIWLLISVFWVVVWSEDVIETGVISDEFLIVAFGSLAAGLGYLVDNQVDKGVAPLKNSNFRAAQHLSTLELSRPSARFTALDRYCPRPSRCLHPTWLQSAAGSESNLCHTHLRSKYHCMLSSNCRRWYHNQ